MDACPNDAALDAYANGRLDASSSEDLRAHLVVCTTCSDRISSCTGVVQTIPETLTVPSSRKKVGRYALLRMIGAGAMGAVYEAHDTELDRYVAIKLLRERWSDERSTAERLRREAKAMARLAHPNVVAVYDIGETEGQAYLTMELIDGVTVSAWLKEKPRHCRDILECFLQAGRGLAAAHAVGIIHRDFKPDNVLIGRDGRVRVGDFGLAHRSAPSLGQVATASPAALAATVSARGTLAGTPVYMAPDQLRGAAADERSDQFSFCVALFEALYGARPFEGRTMAELLESMLGERLRPPPAGSSVPRSIRMMLSRGLRAKPEARYPSMQALLSGLEARSSARRGRWAAAAIAVLSVAVGTAAFVRERKAEALACAALGHRMDGVWDATARAKVHDAFLATARPYAQDTFARVVGVLDDYAARWTRDVVAQCQAQRKAPADPMAPQRRECMDQRLGELRAFVAVLSRADGTTVDHAVQGAGELQQIQVCDGDDPLNGRRWPSDPTLAAHARALFAQMEITETTRRTGRYGEALTLAEKDSADADRLGFAPLVAEATLALARLQRKTGEAQASEATFRKAILAAERAGEVRITGLAWSEAAKGAAYDGDFALAEDRIAHSEALIDRIGDENVRALAWLADATALGDIGKYDDTRGFARKALGLFEKRGDELHAIEATNVLGKAAYFQGRYDEAADDYGRVLAWDERVLGPDHPTVADPLNNLAIVKCDLGETETELALFQRAQSILEPALGPDHPRVAGGLSNIAETYVELHRFAEALPLAERALRIDEGAFGPDHPDVAYALQPLSEALMGLGRFSEAIAAAERELAIWQRGPPDPRNLADAQADLGLALVLSKHDMKRGRALLLEARATLVRIERRARVPDIDAALAKVK
jgi:serine/threonine-protein kinase